jgi:hypothetical protein
VAPQRALSSRADRRGAVWLDCKGAVAGNVYLAYFRAGSFGPVCGTALTLAVLATFFILAQALKTVRCPPSAQARPAPHTDRRRSDWWLASWANKTFLRGAAPLQRGTDGRGDFRLRARVSQTSPWASGWARTRAGSAPRRSSPSCGATPRRLPPPHTVTAFAQVAAAHRRGAACLARPAPLPVHQVPTGKCLRGRVLRPALRLRSLVAAPVNLFFDVTPVGRIMNRFSVDVNRVRAAAACWFAPARALRRWTPACPTPCRSCCRTTSSSWSAPRARAAPSVRRAENVHVGRAPSSCAASQCPGEAR